MNSHEDDFDLDARDERVERIRVPQYEHNEAGLKLTLKDMTLYLLNEADFGLAPQDFDAARHEHAVPKFEMARIYILVCALTGDSLGFSPADRQEDPQVFRIYEKAYQKLLKTETDRELILKIARLGQQSGFLSELQEAQQEASHTR